MLFEKFIETAVKDEIKKEVLSPNEKLIAEGKNVFDIPKNGINKAESYIENLQQVKKQKIEMAKAYFAGIGDIDKVEALEGTDEIKKAQALMEAEEKTNDLFKETDTNDLFEKFIKTNSFRIGEPSTDPEFIWYNKLDFWESFDEFTDKKYYSMYGMVGPNCMAYAYGIPCNIDGSVFDYKPSPGYFSGEDISFTDIMKYGSPEEIKSTFEKYMKMDMHALGKELVEVDSNDYIPKDGERMIALVTAPDIAGMGSDFHFYVKDKNGFWSHKPGVTNPTIFDNMGNTIRDPLTCDRGYYENFVGYYVIKEK